jgi:hypothetical protein
MNHVIYISVSGECLYTLQNYKNLGVARLPRYRLVYFTYSRLAMLIEFV